MIRSLLIIALGTGVVLGAFVAAESPALSLRTVELVGGSSGKVELSDVVSAGRLERGAHLLKLPTEQAARRIETLPWVRDASVERILPSRIRVRIVERRAAFVLVAGSTPWLVDRDGVVLEQGDSGLVHLLDLPLPPLRAGVRVQQDQFDHAARVIESLTPPLRSRLVRVRAASIDRITLELVDGAALVFGAAEELREKNHAARRLLELYDARNIPVERIDVRAPSRPAVKPQGVPAAFPSPGATPNRA